MIIYKTSKNEYIYKKLKNTNCMQFLIRDDQFLKKYMIKYGIKFVTLITKMLIVYQFMIVNI